MVQSAETSSTKSSLVSSKAASFKKSVKKTTRAVAQPFKKLKQSLSVSLSWCSSHSQSMVLPLSDGEPGNNNECGDDELISGHQIAGNENESDEESKMTPEKELHV